MISWLLGFSRVTFFQSRTLRLSCPNTIQNLLPFPNYFVLIAFVGLPLVWPHQIEEALKSSHPVKVADHEEGPTPSRSGGSVRGFLIAQPSTSSLSPTAHPPPFESWSPLHWSLVLRNISARNRSKRDKHVAKCSVLKGSSENRVAWPFIALMMESVNTSETSRLPDYTAQQPNFMIVTSLETACF
jgi:hypothetical protein